MWFLRVQPPSGAVAHIAGSAHETRDRSALTRARSHTSQSHTDRASTDTHEMGRVARTEMAVRDVPHISRRRRGPVCARCPTHAT